MSAASRRKRPARLASMPLLLVVVACGSVGLSTRLEPFASSYPDNILGDLEPVLARIENAPGPSRGTVLVAAVPGRDEVLGWDLARGRKAWTIPRKADARPVVSQGLVIFPSGSSVWGFSAEDGSERFEVDLEGRSFRGASVCPSTGRAYVVLGLPERGAALDEDAGRSALVAMAPDGSEAWREEIDRLVGAPAALAGLVAVPWEQQYVSLLDGENGDEIARIRSGDDVFSFVRSSAEGLYYGGTSIYRLSPRSVAGTKQGTDRVEPELGDLPGDARVGLDGFAPRPGRGARDKIRVHWAPAAPAGEPVRLDGGAIYFQYYRYLFAFEVDGTLRWAYRHEKDLVAAQSLADAVLVVAEDGGLALLTSDQGLVAWTGSVGSAVELAELDAAGFAPTRRAAGEPVGVRERLLELAFDTDNRMVPARQLAVRRLARIDDPAITADLIEIASRRSLAQGIRDTAGQMLLDREVGQQELLAALDRHYNFLDGTEAAPVGIIARAAMRMEARDAVPALLLHLADHETETKALPDLVSAIKALGDPSAVPALLDFLTRYHADEIIEDEGRSLVLAAEALGAWGDESHAQELDRMAEDRFTLAALVPALRAARSDILARVHPSDTVDTTEEGGEQAPVEPQEPTVPRLLDMAAVSAVLGEHDSAMRRCAYLHRGTGAPPARLRFSFVLTNDSRIMNLTMTPPNEAIFGCIRPMIEESVFPTFMEARQTINWTFHVRPGG